MPLIYAHEHNIKMKMPFTPSRVYQVQSWIPVEW